MVQWIGLHAFTAGGMGSEPDWGIKIPHVIYKLKFFLNFNWGLTKFLPWSPPDSRDLLSGSQVLFHLVISLALSNRHHFPLLTSEDVWGLFILSVFRGRVSWPVCIGVWMCLRWITGLVIYYQPPLLPLPGVGVVRGPRKLLEPWKSLQAITCYMWH